MNLVLKVALVVLLLAAVFVTYQFFRTRHFIRVGVGLAQAAVPFERPIPGAPVRILNIGDSSVVGTGSADPNLTIAGRLGAAYPEAEIVNEGVNGRKTVELVGRLRDLQGEHYDLVVIHTGGNDIVRFTPYEEIEANLDAALDLAILLSDQVLVLHGGNVGTAKLLPLGSRWIFTQRTKRVREIFIAATAARPGVFYVDIFRRAKNDPFATDPEKFYAPDNFHPSGEGYGDWFRFIQATIAENKLELENGDLSG